MSVLISYKVSIKLVRAHFLEWLLFTGTKWHTYYFLNVLKNLLKYRSIWRTDDRSCPISLFMIGIVTILLYLKLLIWPFRQDEYHYQRFSGVRSDECYELKSFTVEERENQTFCCKSETLQHHQSLRKMMTIG